MATVNAYINFNGQCKEAMEFYKESLGGELFLQSWGAAQGAECPQGMENQIIHSSLTNGDFVLMATDMGGTGEFIKGNHMALSVNCTSEEEINRYFANLSADGNVIDAIKKQFWGALFGVLVDKYGMVWMLNFQID